MAFNFMQSLVRQSIDTDTNVNLGTSVDEEEGDIDDESDVEFDETDGLDLDLDQEQAPADNENLDQDFDPDNAGVDLEATDEFQWSYNLRDVEIEMFTSRIVSRPKYCLRFKTRLSDADVHQLLDKESSEISMEDTSGYKLSESDDDFSSFDEKITETTRLDLDLILRANPVKVWNLCDTITSYTQTFEIYKGAQGQAPARNQEETTTYSLVIRLLEAANVLHFGHHLGIDNYFHFSKASSRPL
ncbi:hypothetical protein PoB_001739000 [Plakobranchus ocellatus]|uniref:PiggyBac transposable element-derived protein domain-containing protein n=1 Tax=Plakobranchus ocellatus TaxID=259542 RepID=A0AAV3Z6X2_9GAST|nr:hypothetical protein PoB_001739000 [Plakobranchus ocellatus]